MSRSGSTGPTGRIGYTTIAITPSSSAPRISSIVTSPAKRTISAFQASSIVTTTPHAAASRSSPCPARMPRSAVASTATDVVISSERSRAKDRQFTSVTSGISAAIRM